MLHEMSLERLAANNGKRAIPENEVLASLGITQDDLDAVSDSEIEFE